MHKKIIMGISWLSIIHLGAMDNSRVAGISQLCKALNKKLIEVKVSADMLELSTLQSLMGELEELKQDVREAQNLTIRMQMALDSLIKEDHDVS